MQLAFGGQPNPRDYGRVLADGALLIYIGCIGLLQHSHETRAEALFVSLIGLVLYASVCYAETSSLRNAGLLGIALGLLTLTRGWVVPLALWFCLLFFLCWLRQEIRRTVPHLLLGASNSAWPTGTLAWHCELATAARPDAICLLDGMEHRTNRLAES